MLPITVGKWTVRRPHEKEPYPEIMHLDPLRRGLVIEWNGEPPIRTFPVPHRGWAFAWPWIFYKSVQAIRQTRAAYYA